MKKYLDQKGVEHLWSKLSMEDYPNNETLMAVINAIDETKADKSEIENLASETYVNEAINNIDIPNEIYVQNEEPIDAPAGAVWVDTDEDVGFGSGSGNGGVTSWNDLEDKPFGMTSATIQCTYDESHEYNVTLESGKKIYYLSGEVDRVSHNCDTLYACVHEPYYGTCEYSMGEPEIIWGTNALGYSDQVPMYSFTAVDGDASFDFVLLYWRGFDHPDFPGVLLEYEGEQIALPDDGWYVVGKYEGDGEYYIESLYGETITKIDEQFIPDEIARVSDIPEGGGVTSWNDLEDRPFYTEKETVAFNYYPNNPNNIVLESGDIIYYVGENTVYRDESLRVVIPELGQKKLLDSVEKTEYTAHDDEIGDLGLIEAYIIHEDNPWQYFNGVLFFNEWDEMSGGASVVDYEGERITFNVDGWYVLGEPDCMTEVYREFYHRLPEKYIPDGLLDISNVPNVYITYTEGEGNYFDEFYHTREALLNMRTAVGRMTQRFTGWMEIDGVMTAIQQITYIDDEDIIKVAPYGYSFDTKYFVISGEYSDGYPVTLVTVSE